MAVDKSKSLIMAQRLKALRNERGLSHESLRKALMEKYEIDISVDSLKNYEVSKVPHAKAYKNEGMRVEYLRVIAEFYGVSADYILGISDVKCQSADIKMIVETTGISEENVSTLCLAQIILQFGFLNREKNDSFQKAKKDFIDRLGLDKYPLSDSALLSICYNYVELINDVLHSVSSDEGILFDYGSMVATSNTIDSFNGSFDADVQKTLSDLGLVSMPAPEYVRFMSNELSKKLDRYFIERYGHGYY